MHRKNIFRLVFLGLLSLIALTCNVNERGPDTLDFNVDDSLMAPKFDSLHIHVFVVRPPQDTIFRKLVFHAPYTKRSQLQDMVIGHLPSDTFSVYLIAFRKKVPALIVNLPFVGGKAGKMDTIMLPTDTTHRVNRPPIVSLAGADSGKTSFSVKEGTTLSFTLAVTDIDTGDAAGLQSLVGTYCGAAALDTATKVFSFKPSFQCVDSLGDTLGYNLSFLAKDKGNPPLWDTLMVHVTVSDSQSAPRWKNTMPTITGKEGRSMSLRLDSLFLGDAEGDSVAFTTTLGTLIMSPLEWSFTPSFSQAGQETVYVSATDNHKPPMMAKLGLKLVIADSVRPLEVTIESPVNGFVTRDTVVAVRWSLNRAIQTTLTTERLGVEGANGIKRTYRDTLTGNSAFDSITVIRDRVPPSKPSVTGPGLTKNQKPTWSWRSGGNGGAGMFRFKMDDKTLTDTVGVADTSFTPSVNLSEGSHKLFVQERDAVGNWSPIDSNAIARVDITAPVVTIQTPADSLVTNQASFSLVWKLDGVTQTAVTKNLVEGVNTVTQSSTDSAGNVGSASITVTRRSNVIFVNAAVAAGGDGNSWGTAHKYLQTALAAATSGKELWVAKGIYKPAAGIAGKDTNTFDTSFVMKNGVNMYGGFLGKEGSSNSRNWDLYESILSGERGNPIDISDNLRTIVEASESIKFDGVFVEKCYGSAIRSDSGKMEFSNCTIRSNTHIYGVLVLQQSGVTIQNCAFIDNKTLNESYQAGALHIIGSNDAAITTTVKNCRFENNPVGIHNFKYSFGLTVNGCVFKNNLNAAIVDLNGSSSINSSLFIGNKNQKDPGNLFEHGGGGISVLSTDGVTATIKNCIFLNNTSVGSGGAIFSKNPVEIGNCAFVNNNALGSGGAISLVNQDIAPNHSSQIRNSIFVGNTSQYSGSQIIIADQVLTIGYTNIQGGVAGISTNSGATVSTGAGMININPQFKDAANPAGPDGKYFTTDDGLNLSSQNGSPCINTGDPNTAGTTITDITGASRVQSGRIDMGAYEQ